MPRPMATARGSSPLNPARLFTRDQAITALTVAELGESGYPDSHPLVVTLREELR